MFRHLTSISVLFALTVPISVSGEDSSVVGASIRVGIAYENNDIGEGDASIENFGTNLQWTGEKDLDAGLKAIGYVELGLNPDAGAQPDPRQPVSGASETRQAWGGLAGGYGSIRIGTQYAAFYDIVSSQVDIAGWGSCWTEFECSREARVLKYSFSGGPLTYALSFTSSPQDEGRDFADEYEIGFRYGAAGFFIGAAGTKEADNGDDRGGDLVGLVLGGQFSGGSWAITHQMADKDFGTAGLGTNGEDDVTQTTFAGAFGDTYLIYSRQDAGLLNPQYATVGYTQRLGASSLIYYEYQRIDADTEADEVTLARAVFRIDF